MVYTTHPPIPAPSNFSPNLSEVIIDEKNDNKDAFDRLQQIVNKKKGGESLRINDTRSRAHISCTCLLKHVRGSCCLLYPTDSDKRSTKLRAPHAPSDYWINSWLQGQQSFESGYEMALKDVRMRTWGKPINDHERDSEYYVMAFKEPRMMRKETSEVGMISDKLHPEDLDKILRYTPGRKLIILTATFKNVPDSNPEARDGFILATLAEQLEKKLDPEGSIAKGRRGITPKNHFQALLNTATYGDSILVVIHGLKWYPHKKDIKKTFNFPWRITNDMERKAGDRGFRRKKNKHPESEASKHLNQLPRKKRHVERKITEERDPLKMERLETEIQPLDMQRLALENEMSESRHLDKRLGLLRVLFVGPGVEEVVNIIDKKERKYAVCTFRPEGELDGTELE